MFDKPERSVDRVFIHCSASDNPKHDSIDVIRKWHTDEPPLGHGWSDIGYHFFIKRDGTIENGRDLRRTPAAQRGHNRGTIAICVHGLESFTSAQFEALRKLCNEINRSYSYITFHGHNEVNPHKTCPVFNVKEVLGLDLDCRIPLNIS